MSEKKELLSMAKITAWIALWSVLLGGFSRVGSKTIDYVWPDNGVIIHHKYEIRTEEMPDEVVTDQGSST